MKQHIILILLVLLCTGFLAAQDETGPAESFTLKNIRREGHINVVGKLAADRDVLVDTQVPGIVMQVHADTGDRVKKGDTLVTLDNIDLRQQVISMKNQYDRLAFGFAQFKPFFRQEKEPVTNSLLLAAEQARIQADFDKREFIRMQKLFKEGSVPESRFDEAKKRHLLSQTGLRQAENRVQERIRAIHALRREIAVMQERVALLVVRAPFSGTIARTNVEVGAKAGAGPDGNLIHLTDTSRLVFRAGVPEEYYTAVRTGNTVSLGIPGRGIPLKLRVSRVSPVVEQGARSFDIEADVENTDLSLKPGLFCTGRVRFAREGLALPGDFVEREENGDFVRLKNGNRVRVKLTSSPKQNEVFISGPGIEQGTVVVK